VMLRSSNILDTRTLGSYNRRPLSPGRTPRALDLFQLTVALVG
jgi:hypothetical protein